MTTTRILPHDAYIGAVTDALEAAGLTPSDWETSDTELDPRGDGCTTMLSAVLTWTRWHPAVNRDELPDGLALVWESSAGEWQYAARHANGSIDEPEFAAGLPTLATPAAVVATVRNLLAGRPAPDQDAPLWHQAGDTRLAIIGWASEGSDAR